MKSISFFSQMKSLDLMIERKNFQQISIKINGFYLHKINIKLISKGYIFLLKIYEQDN